MDSIYYPLDNPYRGADYISAYTRYTILYKLLCWLLYRPIQGAQRPACPARGAPVNSKLLTPTAYIDYNQAHSVIIRGDTHTYAHTPTALYLYCIDYQSWYLYRTAVPRYRTPTVPRAAIHRSIIQFIRFLLLRTHELSTSFSLHIRTHSIRSFFLCTSLIYIAWSYTASLE